MDLYWQTAYKYGRIPYNMQDLERVRGIWEAHRDQYPTTARLLERVVLAAKAEDAPREFDAVTVSKSRKVLKSAH